MIITREDFKAHFDQMKDRAADGGLSLLMLVAPDVDGICAAQVLAVRAQRKGAAGERRGLRACAVHPTAQRHSVQAAGPGPRPHSLTPLPPHTACAPSPPPPLPAVRAQAGQH